MSPADIIARVKGFVLAPGAEWDKIDGEPADVQAIYTNYVGPLVIAAAIAGFIGLSIVGVYGIRIPMGSGIVGLVLQVALGLASVYIFALVIDALAPSFGAQKNFGQAFKVAAYAPTASWVGSLVMIIPALGILALIAALYSLYLLFLGLPKLMKPPAEKAMIYTLASIGCMIVIGIVLGAIQATIR